MTGFHTYTLSSGLRVIMADGPSEVIYCGIAVGAGTRHELPHESGMAHFTEHMTFKGTERRRSWHVTQRMESVGGDLNAFTGKEETVYYCTCLRQHTARAIDLLFDVVQHSTYPQSEMEKEVEVVVAEIESYNDSPSELIYDEFEARLFQGHPLGRNILGDADLLRRHTSDDMKAFVRRLYTPDRITFFIYGKVDEKRVLKMIEQRTPSQSVAVESIPTTPVSPTNTMGWSEVLHRDCHQTHVMLGSRGFGGNDERHLALFLLNNILGGPAMSSRLGQVLREKNGLVYTVESTLTTYTDTGVWAVYFGCANEDLKRCLRLVHGELQRLTDAPLTAHQLAAAKRQLIGQLGISYDNYENVAIGMGKRFLHYNRTQTAQQLYDRINAITADELLQTARTTFAPERLSQLVMD